MRTDDAAAPIAGAMSDSYSAGVEQLLRAVAEGSMPVEPKWRSTTLRRHELSAT